MRNLISIAKAESMNAEAEKAGDGIVHKSVRAEFNSSMPRYLSPSSPDEEKCKLREMQLKKSIRE